MAQATGENVVLVDRDDVELGLMPKIEAHLGKGTLHRAFSVLVFDGEGRILLQKRSAEKMLWPLFWSNACCSHPRKNEDPTAAAKRRVEEELGIVVSPKWLYKFEYEARFGDLGSEHELCYVFIAASDATPKLDPSEVAEFRYLSAAELDAEIAIAPDTFSPWFKLEWARVRRDFWADVEALRTR